MLRRRTPRFLNEEPIKKDKVTSGRLTYRWDLPDEFEMTEELDNKIQKMVFNTIDGFWMIKLEKLLSNVLNMDMRLGRCATGSDVFEMQFVGRPGLFKIAINF